MDSINTNAIEQRKIDELDLLVRNCIILVDTCSWMHEMANLLIEHIAVSLKRYGKKIILPYSVNEELRKLQNNPEKKDMADRAAKVINYLIKEDLIEGRGGFGDTFADNKLFSVINEYRMKQDVLLITQDVKLSRDVLTQNELKSAIGHPVKVYRINRYGYLSMFVDNAAAAPAMFRLCRQVTAIPEMKVPVNKIPGEGDQVFIGGKRYIVGDRIGGGGEGNVYTVRNLPGKVIKVYNEDCITERRIAKLRLMLDRQVTFNGICWPEQEVQNAYSEPVGYVMNEAKGFTPQRSIFIKPLFEQRFPGWKREDLVQLCITVLEKIEHLHKMNVLLGDINPENMLISSPEEVYFVDCDSYQVQDFPCPVGTVNFTPPELQGKRYDTLLRSFGNEYFAVATLLFMLMMPGKPPYAQQGGGEPAENVRNMDFSYPFGKEKNGKQPNGLWRFMWSHLTYKVKEMFYNVFTKDGTNSSEGERYSTAQWLAVFRDYKKLLAEGKLQENDEQSGWIYPDRFKYYTVKCGTCGKDISSRDVIDGNCPECDGKLKIACKDCGTRFKPCASSFGRCKTCNDKAARHIKCGCGKIFAFTYGEQSYYRSKGLVDPGRCPECRQGRNTVNPADKQPANPPKPQVNPTPKPQVNPAPKPSVNPQPPTPPRRDSGLVAFLRKLFTD